MVDADNDKISGVILLFASVQSNSVGLEGSCQTMVYRSVVLVGSKNGFKHVLMPCHSLSYHS